MKVLINILSIWIKSTFFLLLIVFVVGCKKMVEVEPPTTAITGLNVYATDATAAAVLTGVYSSMSGFAATSFISFQAGLSADEFTLFSGAIFSDQILLYKNALSANSAPYFWQFFYGNTLLLPINAAIEGIENSTTLTHSVKQQLLGEAKFLRAFFYFYLVNLYGDVPLITTSDWRTSQYTKRTSKAVVYQQIIQDLKDAQNLLSTNYVAANALSNTVERVRPNKGAATALLARVYLYTGENWANAEAEATSIINNTTQYGLVTLNNVFFKNSNEAIWQLQPVNKGWNTEDARLFKLPASGPNGFFSPVYLSPFLINAFEPNDQRKTFWLDSVIVGSNKYKFPVKYKSATENSPVTEYQMVMRLSEQYLIRAEARAQQDNFAGAQSDLNAVRTRAGLPNTTATDKPSLLSAILHERQVELFSEWGHRWFDLKRTDNVDMVMEIVATQKGGIWNTNWQWYPLPYDQVRDFNLPQNTGY